MDFTDLLIDTSDEYLTGYYFPRRPKTQTDGRITFKYKQLDPNARIFNTVLGNVREDSATYAISTNDMCGFKIGGYIVTQNGLFWTITEVITNEQADGQNAVLRWFKRAKSAKINIRMTQVENLYTEQTYGLCAVSVLFSESITGATITAYETPEQSTTDIPYTIEDNELVFNVTKGVMVLVSIQYANGEKTQTVKITRSETSGSAYAVDVVAN